MKVAMENPEFGFDPREFDTDPVAIAYRNALGDGLERVLAAGAETLTDIVTGLNANSVTTPDGTLWTEESLAAELNRLAQ
jgi:hypothetical protein